MNIKYQSEVGIIKSILLKHPKDAYISQEKINDTWEELNYTEAPNLFQAIEEYENFVNLIKSEVEQIIYLPENKDTGIDSIYVRDPIVMTDRGALLCNMGKLARRSEPSALKKYFEESEIQVLGKITGNGRLESGDMIWLDGKTIAVGQGYRTNAEGIDQLRQLTSDFVEEIYVVPLPHWNGPQDVMHLMSFISPVDYDIALVYSRIMPVSFRQWLINRDIKLIEVPDEEFDSMGCNVLATSPSKCIMLEGNPITHRLLEKAGVEVNTYKGTEISLKGAGGPTCLTRPLCRE